jgi:hypothetical protein
LKDTDMRAAFEPFDRIMEVQHRRHPHGAHRKRRGDAAGTPRELVRVLRMAAIGRCRA